jgi:hypothetical protein
LRDSLRVRQSAAQHRSFQVQSGPAELPPRP